MLLHTWGYPSSFPGEERERECSVENFTSLSEEISPVLIICAMYLEMERLCKYHTALLVNHYLLTIHLVMAGNLLDHVVQLVCRKLYQWERNMLMSLEHFGQRKRDL